MKYPDDFIGKIINGDCLAVLKSMPNAFINTVVTSPPYWGLRDYGVKGQLGLEKTPDEYVAKMVEIFREVRRVLRDDGTLWLNLGDSYAASSNTGGTNSIQGTAKRMGAMTSKGHAVPPGLKPKDLVGIPWRVAFALQSDGWYLRSDIIWSKPNPMPESVTDRPTRAHEYIFLLTKSKKYFYDAEAIKEQGKSEITPWSVRKEEGEALRNSISSTTPALNRKPDKQRGHSRRHAGFNEQWDNMTKTEQCSLMRNKRSVWEVATQPYSESHFATFPEKLIEPCVLAGCPKMGIVFDPFMGSGTTALVACKLNRQFTGIELNPEYIKMAEKRVDAERAQLKMF